MYAIARLEGVNAGFTRRPRGHSWVSIPAFGPSGGVCSDRKLHRLPRMLAMTPRIFRRAVSHQLT